MLLLLNLSPTFIDLTAAVLGRRRALQKQDQSLKALGVDRMGLEFKGVMS